MAKRVELEKLLEIAPGIGNFSEATTLSSMSNRRTAAPGAPWSVPPEMQPEEKVALYNRKTKVEGHLKFSVS